MVEPYDPIPPKRSEPPPLPRLWKNLPEPEEPIEAVPANAKPKRSQGEADAGKGGSQTRGKKKKKTEDVLDDGTGATKLEETPVLDTYEARQRARWIIGGLLGTIGLIGLVIVLRAFKGGGSEEIRDGEPPEIRATGDSRANGEVEARNILDNSKQADKLGKSKASIDLLNKLAKNYQNTAAGREAMHALDRGRRNRPLFGVDIPEQVSGPKPPPPGTSLVIDASPPKNPGSSIPGPTAPKPVETAPPASVSTPVAPTIITKPLPAGYRAKFDFPVHPSGWPTRIVCDHDDAELVLVPAGTFLMGREDGDPAERPSHQVSLSTYYIDQHEVTVRQFYQFLKETGRPIDAAKLVAKDAVVPPASDDHPVVNVSEREAKAYCNWAGRRLPTEAQWEMAARSTDGRISYWNGELPRKDPPRSPRPMEPAMSLPSDISPYGAFDMAANAWEWTADYYDSRYYKQFRNLVIDPTGPKESLAGIAVGTVKGGSKSGILTWREGLKLETRLPYLGFRGALPVEGLPVAPVAVPSPNNTPALPGGVVPF